jgi:hypothetical protein
MALSSQPDPVLTITGPTLEVQFVYFEIPEFIKFGGPFRAIVHKQPGGTRQIDSMGPDPGPISWDGIMMASGEGGSGVERANILYAMYEAGDKVTVTWANWPSRDCIISDLKIKYRAINYTEYFIELTEVIQAQPDAAGNVDIQAAINAANAIGGLQ